MAGNDESVVKDALQELLKDKVSVGGQAKRSNREKIITILLKTWVTIPTDLEELRDEGLEHLKRLPRSDHLIIHWGMATAVYPFWSSVALQVGRLLRLQDSAAAAHVVELVQMAWMDRWEAPGGWWCGWCSSGNLEDLMVDNVHRRQRSKSQTPIAGAAGAQCR